MPSSPPAPRCPATKRPLHFASRMQVSVVGGSRCGLPIDVQSNVAGAIGGGGGAPASSSVLASGDGAAGVVDSDELHAPIRIAKRRARRTAAEHSADRDGDRYEPGGRSASSRIARARD